MTTRRRVRQTRMRASQKLIHPTEHRIVEEGEVFIYEGEEIPGEHWAVPVDDSVPLGPEPRDANPLKVAPPWTSPGYINQAAVARGRREEAAELLS